MIPYRQLRARIERDKAKKEARRAAARAEHDRLEKVFTVRHYIREAQKCRKGVSFKLSVQHYTAKPLRMIEEDCRRMLSGRAPAPSSSQKVIIRERGKERIITPIRIRDRVNQRVLCDYALTPMINRRLIYDNGASTKGKGVSFARKRLNAMIEQAKRMWGDEFWALSFDFRKFFDSIPHRLCREELRKTFRDGRIADVAMEIIEGYQLLDARRAGDWAAAAALRRHEGAGVCLGSHVSQLMALCVPNFLDHYIKDVRRVKLYIRYMDDGIILGNDPAALRALLRDMDRICQAHGLALNRQKTHITPIRKGILFLKIRYRVENGKTIRRLHRSTVIRMRRRLKRYTGLMESGKMSPQNARDSFQSWTGHTLHAMAYRQRKRMKEIWRGLYEAGKWGCAEA